MDPVFINNVPLTIPFMPKIINIAENGTVTYKLSPAKIFDYVAGSIIDINMGSSYSEEKTFYLNIEVSGNDGSVKNAYVSETDDKNGEIKFIGGVDGATDPDWIQSFNIGKVDAGGISHLDIQENIHWWGMKFKQLPEGIYVNDNQAKLTGPMWGPRVAEFAKLTGEGDVVVSSENKNIVIKLDCSASN